MPVRYALLIYGEEGIWAAASDEERAATYRQHADYGTWLRGRGWLRGGEELAGSSSATCVRVEDGRTLSTDGPVAETDEQLGGFYLIECDDLDQAIEAASHLPTSDRGTVEVRPIGDNN